MSDTAKILICLGITVVATSICTHLYCWTDGYLKGHRDGEFIGHANATVENAVKKYRHRDSSH